MAAAAATPVRSSASARLLNQILEGFERRCANFLLRRLSLDGDGLLGERIDAGTILGGRFLDRAKLQQPRDHELAVRLAQLFLNELRQTVKDATDALLVELR